MAQRGAAHAESPLDGAQSVAQRRLGLALQLQVDRRLHVQAEIRELAVPYCSSSRRRTCSTYHGAAA